MLWIILIIVLMIGGFIWGTIEDDLTLGVPMSLIGLLLGALILVVGSSCAYGIQIDNFEYQIEDSTQIICLKDNQNIESYYYLLSGSADENLYYYYMYEDEELGISYDKVNANKCYINYTNENYRIEKMRGKCKNRFVGKWLGADAWCGKKYKVYIPENSITVENTYNIDLE